MVASFFGRLLKSRWARLAPFLLIGPISGPLLAGVVFNIRGGRPILAMLYAILLTLFIILLPLVTARALSLHV
jgi:hypothetical protein